MEFLNSIRTSVNIHENYKQRTSLQSFHSISLQFSYVNVRIFFPLRRYLQEKIKNNLLE